MDEHSRLKITDDGSHTVYSSRFREDYHSIHGAVAESMHVFMRNGLHVVDLQSVRVLEIGFGTGLNAWLTLLKSIKDNQDFFYHTVEAFPLEEPIYSCLNYSRFIGETEAALFAVLHSCAWNQNVQINTGFTIHKSEARVQEVIFKPPYDVVYFDAFSPQIQPELWTTDLFLKIFNSMNRGAVLVTYCAKGQVRRNMQAAGFITERLPGAPGKREMLRARKE